VTALRLRGNVCGPGPAMAVGLFNRSDMPVNVPLRSVPLCPNARAGNQLSQDRAVALCVPGPRREDGARGGGVEQEHMQCLQALFT